MFFYTIKLILLIIQSKSLVYATSHPCTAPPLNNLKEGVHIYAGTIKRGKVYHDSMWSLCLQYILHWRISNKLAITFPLPGIKENGIFQRNAISKQQLYGYFGNGWNWHRAPAALPLLSFPKGNQCLITFNTASLLLPSLHLLWNHNSLFSFLP